MMTADRPGSAGAAGEAEGRWKGSRTPRLRLAGTVAIIFATVVGVSQLTELFINRILRPDLEEWTWISEVFLVVALLVLATLWARLQLARTAIADLERDRLMFQTELAIAAKVQRALLPPIPDRMHGIVWHAVMEPAGQVGGDYYDFFPLGPLGDDRMCVVIADVSGKGVPAAVFVSNTRATLRAIARERSTPSSVLAAVSEMILLDARGATYVTCVIAFVDTVRHTMVYANAGHPPGVILSAERGARALDIGGPPLGLLAASRYDEELITLNSGDLFVLVSDGISDAINATGDGIPAALGAELANLREKTPEMACNALLGTHAGRRALSG